MFIFVNYCTIFFHKNQVFILFFYYIISLLLKLSNIVTNISIAQTPNTAKENSNEVEVAILEFATIDIGEVVFTNILSAILKLLNGI